MARLPGHAGGEQNVNKGSFLHIVPLDPAYPAGSGTGHVPAKDKDSTPEHRRILFPQVLT